MQNSVFRRPRPLYHQQPLLQLPRRPQTSHLRPPPTNVDEQLRALLMRVRQCDRSIAAAFSHAGHALLESLKQLSPSPPLPLSAPRAAGVPSPPLSAPQAAGVTAMPDVLPVITPLDDTAAPELDVAPAPDAAPALHATPTAVDTLAAQ